MGFLSWRQFKAVATVCDVAQKRTGWVSSTPFDIPFRLPVPFYKGPFKYYVSKIVGGWGWPNDYVCLHSGWVGVAKCLRNQKNRKKGEN